MNIPSIEQAEAILKTYVPAVSRTGDDQSLERMWPALAKLGNPQDALKIIHIAGTSGKTSTAYFIASLLQTKVKKVGLAVSPHVDSITERIQIDGKPIADKSFCDYLGEFLELIDEFELSYFELLIVFTFWVYSREKMDYVVLETGMGGLYDGTNVATRSDKVCVITDIGFDHMHVLGNTLAEIAAQKAGIIHENNTVFSQMQEPKAAEQLRKRATEKHATLHILTSYEMTDESLTKYQVRNWSLAKEAAEYISARDGIELSSIQPTQVQVPGRMEHVHMRGREILMDGAHNRQKMAAFVESFQAVYPDKKAHVLLALKEGKELQEVLDELEPIAASIIATEFKSYQDLPFQAMSAEAIAQAAKDHGIRAETSTDLTKSFDTLVSKDGILLVTGSFYLLGDIRKL